MTSLRKLGWKVLTLWECETMDEIALEKKLLRFLS
jgi:G:T-mismatch repair DNA endonuclease (very short patch repair protein)